MGMLQNYIDAVSGGIDTTGRVLGTAVGGVGMAPGAGIAGLVELINSRDLNKANSAINNASELTNFIKTPEQQKSLEYLNLPMKPIQMAGEGWGMIGKQSGIPYAEPFLNTMGQVAAMGSIPGLIGKGKSAFLGGLEEPIGTMKFASEQPKASPYMDLGEAGKRILSNERGLLGNIDNVAKLESKISKKSTQGQGSLDTLRTTRDYFGKDIGAESQEYIKWVYNNRGKSAITPNQKTGLSMDFSKSCPMRESAKGACPYCYVEHPRTMKTLGIGQPMSPSGLQENFYRNEIKYMPPKLINELNRDGGLRTFSFGDFRPGIDDVNMTAALSDASSKGLYLKAITKQKEFIDNYGDHPNLRANISTDLLPRNMSNAPTIEEALKWKNGRDNIKVRAVALNRKQAELLAADERVDVTTLYHGPTNFDAKGVRTDKLFKIVKEQNPKLVDAIGEDALRAELDTWENMPPKSNYARELQQRKKSKICCTGGKCGKDPTKCGFGLGSLIAGVVVPEWFDHSEE